MCRKLLEGGAPGLHFYTLNLEKVVVGILKGLGKITDAQASAFQAVEADAKFMVSAQGITTGTKGSRPALSGNRPLSEADPVMYELVQQEKARQTRWGGGIGFSKLLQFYSRVCNFFRGELSSSARFLFGRIFGGWTVQVHRTHCLGELHLSGCHGMLGLCVDQQVF